MKLAGLAAAICAVSAMSASAQDVYVYDGSEYVGPADHPVVVEEHVVRERVIERRYAPARGVIADDRMSGPRVYGWRSVIEIEDCGTFKYWNGDYCADARFEPPPVD